MKIIPDTGDLSTCQSVWIIATVLTHNISEKPVCRTAPGSNISLFLLARKYLQTQIWQVFANKQCQRIYK